MGEHNEKKKRDNLNNAEENKILSFIDITPSNIELKKEERGEELEWFGRRVVFLTSFYGTSLSVLGAYLGLSTSVMDSIVHNKKKPSETTVKRLSFYFEIDERYFTDKEITIKIVGQTKIKLC